MADNDVTLELKGLNQLLKALKEKPPQCRIGILGTGSRQDGNTNATIGAVHEFGAPGRNIPARSFLRMPLSEHLHKKLESGEMLTEEKMKEVIKQGSVKPWLTIVARIGEGIVAEAFDTGGFGRWEPWRTPGYTNQANQLLIDTQSLRNSISSSVEVK